MLFIPFFLHGSIFIAGQNTKSQPTLWITDKRGTKLGTRILDNFQAGKPLSIISNKTQVFICGQTQNGATSQPCLWITNVFGIIPQKILLSKQAGTALSMACDTNRLYIAGSCSNQSTLWIVDLNSHQVIKQPIGVGYIISSLTIASERLYLIGATSKLLGPINAATLWICDLQGNLEGGPHFIANIGTVPSSLSQADNFIYILSCNGNNPSRGYYLTKVNLDGTVQENVRFEILSSDSPTYNLSIVDSTSFMLTAKGIYTTPLSEMTSTPYDLALPISSSKWNDCSITNQVSIAGVDTLSRASLFIYDIQGNLINTANLDDSGSSASCLIHTPYQLNPPTRPSSQPFFEVKKGLFR